MDDKAKRYWGYLEILMDVDCGGEIKCADCGTELSLGELKDNYDDPLCGRCVWALKN